MKWGVGVVPFYTCATVLADGDTVSWIGSIIEDIMFSPFEYKFKVRNRQHTLVNGMC